MFPEIHIWCDTYWLLDGQQDSQAILFHTPVSRHWWGLKQGSIVPPMPPSVRLGRRSTELALPASSAQHENLAYAIFHKATRPTLAQYHNRWLPIWNSYQGVFQSIYLLVTTLRTTNLIQPWRCGEVPCKKVKNTFSSSSTEWNLIEKQHNRVVGFLLPPKKLSISELQSIAQDFARSCL